MQKASVCLALSSSSIVPMWFRDTSLEPGQLWVALKTRDHSGYRPSQWENTLPCKAVSLRWAHTQNGYWEMEIWLDKIMWFHYELMSRPRSNTMRLTWEYFGGDIVHAMQYQAHIWFQYMICRYPLVIMNSSILNKNLYQTDMINLRDIVSVL